MSKTVRFDWAIKYLLRNKANFDILEGFLSELLETSIKIESILESESNKNHDTDKYNRVDLLVKSKEGKHIIIELQCSRQWDYLSRVLYGTSKVVCEQLYAGDEYGKIPKIISISIVFFDLGLGKDYLYQGKTTFRGKHFADTLELNPQERKVYQQTQIITPQTPADVFPEYYLIKVSAFHEQVNDKIDEWIYFLKRGEIKQEFVAQGIQSAAQKLNILNLSKEDRKAYEHYEEGLHDDASFNVMLKYHQQEAKEEGEAIGLEKGKTIGLKEGEAIGLEKGEAIGEARGELKTKYAFAKKLYAENFPLEQIASFTELTLTELKQLLKSEYSEDDT